MAKIPRSLEKLIEFANLEVNKIQAMSAEDRSKWTRAQPLLPPSIPVGDGRVVYTTKEGLAALHEYGHRWRDNDDERKRLLGAKKAEELAVRAYGRLIVDPNSDQLKTTREIKKALNASLEKEFLSIQIDLTHYLPCQIFNRANLPSFDVGPVQFVPRDSVLDIMQKHSGEELAWTDAVRNSWSGGPKLERPKPQDFSPEGPDLSDRWIACDIEETFAQCRWAAVIEIPGREFTHSRSHAEAAVRIALDTLGLVLSPGFAQQIRHVADDIGPRMTYKFAQAKGNSPRHGSYLDMPMLQWPSDGDEWLLKETTDLRQWAGFAIQTLIEAKPTSKIPGLHQRWLDAMYWFGESRREPVEFIGLVKAGICLDVLAKGGAAKGIEALCQALFNLAPTDSVLNDGTSLKKLVETIYNEGRSQIGHGGRPSLLKDLPISRDTAVLFAKEAMARYIKGLHHYSGPDVYEDFLKALPQLLLPQPAQTQAPVT